MSEMFPGSQFQIYKTHISGDSLTCLNGFRLNLKSSSFQKLHKMVASSFFIIELVIYCQQPPWTRTFFPFSLPPQKINESQKGLHETFYSTRTNWTTTLLNSISGELLVSIILGGYTNWIESFLLGYEIRVSNFN